MDLKEEALLGDGTARHWYYRAKLAALTDALAGLPPGIVLDVGAGSGFFARSLLERGAATQAVCVDPGYAADHDETVATRPLAFRRELPAAAADAVLMMDVLEHVADDGALLRSAAGRLAPGGRIVVTVPAFQWLWSGHDVFLGHYRRYTLGRLERLLRDAGLRVEFAHYLYGAVLPMVAIHRLGRRLATLNAGAGASPARSDMRPFSPASNALLGAACAAERPFARRNRLGGLTVLARAMAA